MAKGASAEKVVKEIRRKTRRKFSAEEKVRIVLEGLRGEESIATLCRREGIDTSTPAGRLFMQMRGAFAEVLGWSKSTVARALSRKPLSIHPTPSVQPAEFAYL